VGDAKNKQKNEIATKIANKKNCHSSVALKKIPLFA